MKRPFDYGAFHRDSTGFIQNFRFEYASPRMYGHPEPNFRPPFPPPEDGRGARTLLPTPTAEISTVSKNPASSDYLQSRRGRMPLLSAPMLDSSMGNSSGAMVIDYGHGELGNASMHAPGPVMSGHQTFGQLATNYGRDGNIDNFRRHPSAYGDGQRDMQIRFSAHLDALKRTEGQVRHDSITMAGSKQKSRFEDNYASREGEEFYYRLAVDAMNQYDKSYEQSIWDYDPKFTWDYLPGTNRGTTRPSEFICGQNYYEQETKWKRAKYETQMLYAHEINERKAKLERGESLYDVDDDTPVEICQPDGIDRLSQLFNQLEEKVGFPEDGITEEFCKICDISFQSVLDSIGHYDSCSHKEKVKRHFVDGLIKLGALSSADPIPDFIENGIINRALNKYKTRPFEWKCALCEVPLSSQLTAETHFNGLAHKKRQKTMYNVFLS